MGGWPTAYDVTVLLPISIRARRVGMIQGEGIGGRYGDSFRRNRIKVLHVSFVMILPATLRNHCTTPGRQVNRKVIRMSEPPWIGGVDQPMGRTFTILVKIVVGAAPLSLFSSLRRAESSGSETYSTMIRAPLLRSSLSAAAGL